MIFSLRIIPYVRTVHTFPLMEQRDSCVSTECKMRVQLFPVPLRMVDRKKDREGGSEWGWGRMEASCSNAHGDGQTDPNAKEGKGRREWLMHTKAAERERASLLQ